MRFMMMFLMMVEACGDLAASKVPPPPPPPVPALTSRVGQPAQGARTATAATSRRSATRTEGQLLLAPVAPVAVDAPGPCDWTDATSASRRGKTCAPIAAARVVARRAGHDPFVADEIDDAEAFGWGRRLLGRQGATLTVGRDVYATAKLGPYTPCSTVGPTDPCGPDLWGEQTWGVVAYRWVGDELVEQWRRSSTWHPFAGSTLSQSFEPVFQPAIRGMDILIPEAGGRVSVVSRATGLVTSTIASPATAPERAEIVSPISVVGEAAVYAINQQRANDPYEAERSWVVRAPASGTPIYGDLHVLAGNACPSTHRFSYWPYASPPKPIPALPWPPAAPDDIGPLMSAGRIRATMNSAVMPSPDGASLYLALRCRNDSDTTRVLEVSTSDLTWRHTWIGQTGSVVRDACGVLVPSTAQPGSTDGTHCRVGTYPGVRRETGVRQGPAGVELSSSSLTVVDDGTPEGIVLLGGYSGYDNERGHLFALKFERGQAPKNVWASNYGWNITPSQVDETIVSHSLHFDHAPFFAVGLTSTGKSTWRTEPGLARTCTRGSGETYACSPLPLLDGSGQNNREVLSLPLGERDDVAITGGGVPSYPVSRSPLPSSDGSAWVLTSDGSLVQIDASTGRVLSRAQVDASLAVEDAPVTADAYGRAYVAGFGGDLVVLGQ